VAGLEKVLLQPLVVARVEHRVNLPLLKKELENAYQQLNLYQKEMQMAGSPVLDADIEHSRNLVKEK
jgi:hypothetical protein